MPNLEKIPYGGWKNCLKLSDAGSELVVTLDVGPRVIRYARPGGQNLFKEFAEQMGKTSGAEWFSFGGHRLWHAPEIMPRTYAPDFDPVAHTWKAGVLTLKQRVEPSTGIEKTITIQMLKNCVRLDHELINRNVWGIEIAPWGLSVMNEGGRAILPQETFIPHPEALYPARPLVLWHFLLMNDPRVTWGARFIQLREDAAAGVKLKFGARNAQRWAAYTLGDNLFIKTFACLPGVQYPDFGCNCEFYTQPGFLEIESLGPLTRLEPGQSVKHTEFWHLWKCAPLPTDEAALEKTLKPYVDKLQHVS
jgi:hypothetical protein